MFNNDIIILNTSDPRYYYENDMYSQDIFFVKAIHMGGNNKMLNLALHYYKKSGKYNFKMPIY